MKTRTVDAPTFRRGASSDGVVVVSFFVCRRVPGPMIDLSRPFPTKRAPRLLVSCLALLVLASPRPSRAQAPDTTAMPTQASPDSTAPSTAVQDSIAIAAPSYGGGPRAQTGTAEAEELRRLGLENVTVGSQPDSAGAHRVAYEDRRYRHLATELGKVSRVIPTPALVFERRLGLTSAAIELADGSLPSRVTYPSEGRFPKTSGGSVLWSTRRSLDVLIDPLFTYELPRIFSPTLARIELQPEIRFNPWPGGRGRIAIVIPIHNDFEPDSLHPDIDRARPGPILFEQYGWSPGSALVSACGGLFGFNRYGLSFGLARPLRGGEFLLDSQADITGFFAASDSGLAYSSLGRWTGFIGAAYRPRGLDLKVRLRAEKFLEKDRGFELEVSRLMGDLELTFDWQRTHVDGADGIPPATVNNGVVKLTLPIPPMERPTGQVIRVLPVENFSVSYREESEPIGVRVANVASREDFLRQLDRSAISSERDHWEAAREDHEYGRRQDQPNTWISMIGMSGFVNTPWAGVLTDKSVEFGYNKIPKEAAYQYRGVHSNEVYYAAIGFLPHFEAGLRWTVMPGSRPFGELVSGSHANDHDRMFSGRLELLEARRNRPGLAIGIEDIHGTRRFHSDYLVVGMPIDIYRLQNRVTLGYAPHVLKAQSRTLDGLFGACEVSVVRRLVTAVEYDSEKPNASLGVDLGFGLRARAVLFDLKHPGIGAGWYRAL